MNRLEKEDISFLRECINSMTNQLKTFDKVMLHAAQMECDFHGLPDGSQFILCRNACNYLEGKGFPLYADDETKKHIMNVVDMTLEVNKKEQVIQILVKDADNNVILTTSSETYKKDIEKNIDKLYIQKSCNVEYKASHDWSTNSSNSIRKILYNGKVLVADYSLSDPVEGVKDFSKELLMALDGDFNA